MEVEDQTDESFIYLNIPKKIDIDELELTDEQLETVSGGDIILITIGITAGLLGCFGTGIAIYEVTHKNKKFINNNEN